VKPSNEFTAIRLEGGLITPELLRAVYAGKAERQSPADYDLDPGTRLIDEVREHWDRLRRIWSQWNEKAWQLGPPSETNADTTGGTTRELWQLPLLRALGFHNLNASRGGDALEVNGRRFPIARVYHAGDGVRVPIHLVGAGVPLDKRSAGVAGAATDRPHAHVQAYLNEEKRALWGLVSDGLVVRLLRDTTSLARPPFIEFDLVRIFEGQDFPSFAVLWLLCHATRFTAERPADCPLEAWSQRAAKEGTRALESLRGGVERAIESLGAGFLSHPANRELVQALRDGGIDKHELFQEVLRIVYRIIFLLVAEERDALHAPSASAEARDLYRDGYALSRIRALAVGGFRGTGHGDLWRSTSFVFERLAEAGAPELGLNALGSYLFSPGSTPHLVGVGTFEDPLTAARFALARYRVELTNRDLLTAMRALSVVVDASTKRERAVDFRSLGAEELGSVYEGLLELHLDAAEWPNRFKLSTSAGNERKTSGSYYTPDSLVQCLLDSALEPVIQAATKGKKGAEAAEAVLNLKVCDPAVGSGHFLIAAAHRLAKHVARARAGDSEPTPDEHRTALREVIRRSMYGIDINPMSAELCRVALWMESMEPGKPLSFLDSHIVVGNSLIGATPRLVAEGIPDDAFEVLEGDDKAVVSALKKRNKQERKDQKKGQNIFEFMGGGARSEDLGSAFASLTTASDASAADVATVAKRHRDLLTSERYAAERLKADAWCAAFFWKKDANPLGSQAITEATFRAIERTPMKFPVGHAIRNEVDRLRDEHGFLHLHLVFPEVIRAPHAGEDATNEQCGWVGGFDCILGNPPWERVKLQEKEWFAERVPQIANAPNAAARTKLIKQLSADRPELHAQFLADVRGAEAASAFMRSSGRYPLCGRGDVNLYTVFAEFMRDGVSPTGRVGCIVPSGIATDDTTKYFFQDLVDRASLASLFDFENREGLFDAVDSRMKFSCLTLRAPAPDEKTAAKAPPAEFVFFAHKVEDLADERRRFTLTRDEIALVNPNTKTCPIFRSKVDAELTKHIYSRVPVLVNESKPDGNPWGVEFTRLFDMSNDSDLFRTREQLDRDGWTLRGNVFERGGERYLPLYEAKMCSPLDHRAAGVVKSLTAVDRQNQAAIIGADCKRLADTFAVPLYWVPSPAVRERAGLGVRWLAGWRNVTSPTNERTGIPCVLPLAGVGHSQPLLQTSAGPRATALVIASLSSFACDFFVRQKLGGVNFTFGVMQQVVIPRDALHSISLGQVVLRACLELSATADDMSPFSKDLWPEGEGAVFRYDPERRFEIRCELDAAFFHLYLGSAEEWSRSASPELLKSLPTPRAAVEYIMETFPIVKRKDLDAHGHYRTKDRILALYDQLQTCLASGQPFTSSLSPPPGPPTNPDGSFASLPAWPKGAPMPANWPSHIHPPVSHRS
jgi:hypothetical protein